MLYLYAIVDSVSTVDSLRGIAGEALQRLTCGALTVVAGDVPEAPRVERALLAAQDRLVRALHESADAVLPMRFGAVFPTVPEAARALGTREPALVEALARVRRREQMTLRILRRSADEDTAPAALARDAERRREAISGFDYLQDRAAAARPAVMQPLIDAVHAMQRGMRVDTGKGAGVIATVYHLIDRGTSGDYRQRIEIAAAALPAVSVRTSGPSPCYAFA